MNLFSLRVLKANTKRIKWCVICHLNPRNSTSFLLWMRRIVGVFVLRLFAFSMKTLSWNWSTSRLGLAAARLWKTAEIMHRGAYYPLPKIWRWFSDNFIFAQWIIENKNCQFFTHKMCHLMRSISGRQHSTIKKSCIVWQLKIPRQLKFVFFVRCRHQKASWVDMNKKINVENPLAGGDWLKSVRISEYKKLNTFFGDI